MPQQESHLKNDRKVLVFLHYFGGSKESWNWVIDLVKDDFQCVALNIPGFGRSEPLQNPSIENLAKAIQEEILLLTITNYTLIAHSMGAKIAVQMAINDLGKTIEQLILIAPSPPGIEPIEEKEKNRILKHPDLKEAKTTVENISKLKLSDIQFNLAVQNNMDCDNKTWNWWINDGMNHSIEKEAKKLTLATTIINSESDPVITPEIIKERVLNVFQKAKLLTTKTSGHLIPMENPEWLADQIRTLVIK